MIDLLPAVCWVAATVWAIAICVICVKRGKLLQSGHPAVEPVSWAVVGAQVVSLVLAMIPFVIGKVCRHMIAADMMDFYVAAAWPAGVVSIVLVIAELALMTMQAQRATFTEMGTSLHGAQSSS